MTTVVPAAVAAAVALDHVAQQLAAARPFRRRDRGLHLRHLAAGADAVVVELHRRGARSTDRRSACTSGSSAAWPRLRRERLDSRPAPLGAGAGRCARPRRRGRRPARARRKREPSLTGRIGDAGLEAGLLGVTVAQLEEVEDVGRRRRGRAGLDDAGGKVLVAADAAAGDDRNRRPRRPRARSGRCRSRAPEPSRSIELRKISPAPRRVELARPRGRIAAGRLAVRRRRRPRSGRRRWRRASMRADDALRAEAPRRRLDQAPDRRTPRC